MNVKCHCLEQFPARDFQRVRDADEFFTRMRYSTFFLPLDRDGVRFSCRRCGRVWNWIIPEEPPFQWRPAERSGE